MINLKVNGRKIKVPTSYEELDYGTLVRISQLKEDDDFGLIAIMLSLSEEEKKKSLDYLSAATVLRCLAFLKEPFPEAYCPGSVNYKDTIIKVGNLESLPFGMYKDLQKMLTAKASEGLGLQRWLVAIWLQFRIEGEYNFSNAENYLEEVDNMTALEVLGLANFFLRRLSELRSGTLKTAKTWGIVRRSLWRALMRWKGSISLIYYQHYVRTLIRLERIF